MWLEIIDDEGHGFVDLTGAISIAVSEERNGADVTQFVIICYRDTKIYPYRARFKNKESTVKELQQHVREFTKAILVGSSNDADGYVDITDEQGSEH